MFSVAIADIVLLPWSAIGVGFPRRSATGLQSVRRSCRIKDHGDRALGKERIEMFSEGRSVILDDFRRLELLKNGRKKIHRAFFRSDKGHHQQCAEFVAAVSEGGPSPISFEEIASCSATTLAIVQAVNTGTTLDLASV